MRRAHILGIALFLLVTPYCFNEPVTHSTETFTLSQDLSPIERDWLANIVAVGYDPSLIDELILLQGLPTVRYYTTDDVEIIYNIDYDVHFADSNYFNDLHQVMLENSINGTGTGSRLDENALSYQKNHLDEPQRIFYPRDGRVIDGYAVEDWLEANPFVTPPNLGYTLYLVNFSKFDSTDHSIEHWYDYHPADPDTGEEQDWFRLEWDNELNPNVTMDYPYFGGRYNTYIVDPSAHQWYLKWSKIWWSESIVTEYDFWTMDLEDKMATLDLDVPADVDALNVYLRECIWDPINLLFFPYQHQPARYVEKGTYTGLVICMDVASGVSTESLEWVIDTDMMKQDLEELYPFIDWTVNIEFLDIDDEPAWIDLFSMHSYVDSGTTIVDGIAMFNTIYDTMRPIYTEDDGNINVFGVVFIKQQMEMHAYGRTYTGLGGQQQTVIWKSWERYYRPDGVTPKDGISSAQLHETMHAIGFHHTWQHEHYASDFSWGPMGYFAYRPGTAIYDKNWVQGTYLDQMEAVIRNDFLGNQSLIGSSERAETYIAEYGVEKSLAKARAFYEEMDWLLAYDSLVDAKDWLKRMQYSMLDNNPPVIVSFSTNANEVGTAPFFYSAIVIDDLAGVENVTLFTQIDQGVIVKYPCSNTSMTNWTVTVPEREPFTNLTMWVVVHDWGMNIATGGLFQVYATSTLPDFSELLIPLAVAVGTSVILIGIGVFIMKRRR